MPIRVGVSLSGGHVRRWSCSWLMDVLQARCINYQKLDVYHCRYFFIFINQSLHAICFWFFCLYIQLVYSIFLFLVPLILRESQGELEPIPAGNGRAGVHTWQATSVSHGSIHRPTTIHILRLQLTSAPICMFLDQEPSCNTMRTFKKQTKAVWTCAVFRPIHGSALKLRLDV